MPGDSHGGGEGLLYPCDRTRVDFISPPVYFATTNKATAFLFLRRVGFCPMLLLVPPHRLETTPIHGQSEILPAPGNPDKLRHTRQDSAAVPHHVLISHDHDPGIALRTARPGKHLSVPSCLPRLPVPDASVRKVLVEEGFKRHPLVDEDRVVHMVQGYQHGARVA